MTPAEHCNKAADVVRRWDNPIGEPLADLLESCAAEWAELARFNRETTQGSDWPQAADEFMDDALALACAITKEI